MLYRIRHKINSIQKKPLKKRRKIMNVRNLAGLLLSLLTLVVLGCGSSEDSSSDISTGTFKTVLSGEAAKGPIIGGEVKIFAIKADGTVQTTPLPTTPATVTTRLPFGNYSAVINYEGPVKVVVTGNSGTIFKDEATGTDVSFAGKSIRAI